MSERKLQFALMGAPKEGDAKGQRLGGDGARGDRGAGTATINGEKKTARSWDRAVDTKGANDQTTEQDADIRRAI
jgi:hypothetical protein